MQPDDYIIEPERPPQSQAVALARDALYRKQADYQFNQARQQRIRDRQRPTYVLQGYDQSGQPLLQPVGGSGAIAGQLDTNGGLEPGTVVDVQSPGGMIRAGGMPCVQPQPQRSTEGRKFYFGYLVKRLQWDRSYLAVKFPSKSLIVIGDTQAEVYDTAFSPMVGKNTIVVNGLRQHYLSYNPSRMPFPTHDNIVRYRFYRQAAGGSSDLFTGVERTILDYRPFPLPYGRIEIETIVYPDGTPYLDFLSPDYHSSGPSPGSGLVIAPIALPPAYRAFSEYTPTLSAGFINPVSTSRAYYLGYENQEATLSTITIGAQGEIRLPTGKLYRVDKEGGVLKETYLRDYAPVVNIADLGVPQHLYPYFEAGGVSAFGLNYLPSRSEAESGEIETVGSLNFTYLSDFQFYIELRLTPYESDPVFGPFIFFSICPFFGIF